MSIINHLCMQVYIDLQRQTHSAQVTPRIQASVSAGVRCADEDVLAVPRPQAPGGGGGGAALTCPVLSSNDRGLRPPRAPAPGFPAAQAAAGCAMRRHADLHTNTNTAAATTHNYTSGLASYLSIDDDDILWWPCR